MASNLRVDTILPSTGTTLGIGTASGTINFLGNSQINTTGVITATSFSGDGSQLTGIDATKIETGNTKVETIDTGSDGHVKITTEGSERFRIINNGKIFVGAYSAGDDFSDEGTFLNIRNNSYGGRIGFSNNTATAGVALMEQFAYWGNNKVAGMIISAGTDTTNKDDASMSFYTSNGGSVTERLRISKEGYVTKPNNLCLQYTSSSANITSGTVIYGTKVFDVGTSNAYNTSNGEFTAPITGVYRIQFEHFASGAGRATARIEKYNGSSWSTAKNGMRVYSVSGGSNWSSVPTIFYLQLNATEKFRIVHLEGTIHLNTPWNHMTVQLVQ